MRRGMVPFLAVVGALALSVGFAAWALVGAAATTCVETATESACSSRPLVGQFWPEAPRVAIPALVCLTAWFLLRRYCSRGDRLSYALAVVLASLSVAFCVLAALSIGGLLLPIAVLLVVAVSATTAPDHA